MSNLTVTAADEAWLVAGVIDAYGAIHFKVQHGFSETVYHASEWPGATKRWRFNLRGWDLTQTPGGERLSFAESEDVIARMRKTFTPPKWVLDGEAWLAAGCPNDNDAYVRQRDKDRKAEAALETDLETRLLYSAVVAGKSATFADAVMARLKAKMHPDETPFAMIKRFAMTGVLREVLVEVRAGNYTKLARCFVEAATSGLNLETCSAVDLEGIHGIGPKSARFFILWTRPDAVMAALDVHVLRWLRAQGHSAPKSTPSGPEYARLEGVFLEEAQKRGMTPRELDFEIWQKGSGYVGSVQSL